MIDFKFIDEQDIYSIIPLLKMLNDTIEDDILKQRLDEMLIQGYKCIGIFDGDKLVGICGIWILTKYYVGKHIEPDNVFISPAYQNQNIGTQLMAWITKYAKENGCIASELNCYVNNKRAQKFWEKDGYEVIGLHFQKKY
ncbi:MAG: GNAT family N-acetyltransferase [Sulfurimonas sp.]